jgi:hypothetical protein
MVDLVLESRKIVLVLVQSRWVEFFLGCVSRMRHLFPGINSPKNNNGHLIPG